MIKLRNVKNGKGSLTIIDGLRPVIIRHTHPHFERALEAFDNGEWERFKTLSRPVEAWVAASKGKLYYSEENKALYYDGEEVSGVLADRLLLLMQVSDNYQPMWLFMEKLWKNPDLHVRKELFQFLVHNDIIIAEDGDVVGYRKVNNDDGYTSIHANPDGSHNRNDIGVEVRMPREQCDNDANNTCSRGLHVGAYHYFRSGGYSGDLTIAVKFSPEDVVAVPNDYNGSKLRTCAYTPLCIVDGPFDMPLYMVDKTDDDDDEDVVVPDRLMVSNHVADNFPGGVKVDTVLKDWGQQLAEDLFDAFCDVTSEDNGDGTYTHVYTPKRDAKGHFVKDPNAPKPKRDAKGRFIK